MLLMLNINEIYRFKEISYSHQIVSNFYDNKKCFDNQSDYKFVCMNKWDVLADKSKKESSR